MKNGLPSLLRQFMSQRHKHEIRGYVKTGFPHIRFDTLIHACMQFKGCSSFKGEITNEAKIARAPSCDHDVFKNCFGIAQY